MRPLAHYIFDIIRATGLTTLLGDLVGVAALVAIVYVTLFFAPVLGWVQ